MTTHIIRVTVRIPIPLLFPGVLNPSDVPHSRPELERRRAGRVCSRCQQVGGRATDRRLAPWSWPPPRGVVPYSILESVQDRCTTAPGRWQSVSHVETSQTRPISKQFPRSAPKNQKITKGFTGEPRFDTAFDTEAQSKNFAIGATSIRVSSRFDPVHAGCENGDARPVIELFCFHGAERIGFRDQKIAIGFTGDPLPPSTGIGANVSMNS